MKGIEFKDFSCYYKHKKDYFPALQSLSFQIHPGEFFVVVGSSGSGKTTLMRSIMGLCEYIEGELTVDGVAIDEFDAKSSNVGYVDQEVTLYHNMTVYENIAFPLRLMHTPAGEIDRRVKEIAAKLDIAWLLTRMPRQLSGGQHQRVAVARALVKKPQLALFDEPFSGLEPKLRKTLCQYILKVHRDYRNTTVYVTHDMKEALWLADRIVLLDNGRVAYLGKPEEMPQEE